MDSVHATLEFPCKHVSTDAWPARTLSAKHEGRADELSPWFGNHRKSFFNTLYSRFGIHPRTEFPDPTSGYVVPCRTIFGVVSMG